MRKSVLSLIAIVTLFNCSLAQKALVENSIDKSAVKASMIKALEWQEAHPIFAIAPTDWTAGAY